MKLEDSTFSDGSKKQFLRLPFKELKFFATYPAPQTAATVNITVSNRPDSSDRQESFVEFVDVGGVGGVGGIVPGILGDVVLNSLPSKSVPQIGDVWTL